MFIDYELETTRFGTFDHHTPLILTAELLHANEWADMKKYSLFRPRLKRTQWEFFKSILAFLSAAAATAAELQIKIIYRIYTKEWCGFKS